MTSSKCDCYAISAHQEIIAEWIQGGKERADGSIAVQVSNQRIKQHITHARDMDVVLAF